MAEKLLGFTELAEFAGVSVKTIRKYHQRATDARRRHEVNPDEVKLSDALLPPPDYQFGQSPVWREVTARKWMNKRPHAAKA